MEYKFKPNRPHPQAMFFIQPQPHVPQAYYNYKEQHTHTHTHSGSIPKQDLSLASILHTHPLNHAP